ncbi:MAG TPA: metallophosphoesterase family protein [Nocardioidaceae bacterium]|nr:metallophosphoesterase family protein [Nocardioidaceae bacterium]
MSEPLVHVEPFVQLVDVSHDRVLVAWGAFWFRRPDVSARWNIVDDEQLKELAGRHTCIGASAEPFGDTHVEVCDSNGEVVAEARTSEHTWVWLDGLQPDTEYRYQVMVDGKPWADGERWDWVPVPNGGYDLAAAGRSYDCRFRTHPDPTGPTPRVKFVAFGDYGVGIKSDSESSRRQRRIAEVLDRVVAEDDVRFIVSLGDNIYQGERGQVDDESGGEDDDWYSSYFQPYRYVLARVPVYPAVGNHDTTDTEGSDDRAQLEDNFFTAERFEEDSAGSSMRPGLFYRVQYGRDLELVCIDTSQADADQHVHRFFQNPRHLDWLRDVFAAPPPRWRIPFSHHPVYCAGPSHGNDAEMLETLVPLFHRGGVRLVLAGHEHNFQVCEADEMTFVVSGAGGNLREEQPEDFEAAHTRAWTGQAHLLLIEVDGAEATLTPVSGLLADGGLHLMTAIAPDNSIVDPPFTLTS